MRRPVAPVAVVPRFKVGDRVRGGRDYMHSATVRQVQAWPRVVWYVLKYDDPALQAQYPSDSYPESQLAPA